MILTQDCQTNTFYNTPWGKWGIGTSLHHCTPQSKTMDDLLSGKDWHRNISLLWCRFLSLFLFHTFPSLSRFLSLYPSLCLSLQLCSQLRQLHLVTPALAGLLQCMSTAQPQSYDTHSHSQQAWGLHTLSLYKSVSSSLLWGTTTATSPLASLYASSL